MTLTIKQASLPAFKITLTALLHILDKAIAYCDVKKIDQSVILQYRLAPDMFPLVRQIQIATDLAKNGLSRLAEVEPKILEDNETSFSQLKERIVTTIKLIESLDYDKINASKNNKITFTLGHTEKGKMDGEDYLNHFIIPNFYFHTAMAYAILRHCGVELGKRDFLGAIPITISQATQS